MKVPLLLIIVFISIFFAGCSQNLTNGYYWDNYSKTQYAYLKNPNQENLSNHIDTLQQIVNVSRNRRLRVPPGVLVELAMMKRLQDPGADISEYLNQEITVYPEAASFVQFLNANLFLDIGEVDND